MSESPRHAHRISTTEVESALVDHPAVAEAAVAGRSDRRPDAIAKPANIVFTPELPKTGSGKITRRLLRDVAEKRELGDTTTLADPTVVDEIKHRAAADAGEEG